MKTQRVRSFVFIIACKHLKIGYVQHKTGQNGHVYSQNPPFANPLGNPNARNLETTHSKVSPTFVSEN